MVHRLNKNFHSEKSDQAPLIRYYKQNYLLFSKITCHTCLLLKPLLALRFLNTNTKCHILI